MYSAARARASKRLSAGRKTWTDVVEEHTKTVNGVTTADEAKVKATWASIKAKLEDPNMTNNDFGCRTEGPKRGLRVRRARCAADPRDSRCARAGTSQL